MIKTKIKQLFSWQRLFAFSALVFLVALSFSQILEAQTLTQGYGADVVMQKGMIVQINKEDPSKVKLVTAETIDQMHGVVVDANDAPVTLSAEGQKVFIATTGKFGVLVSDQAGPIKAGDYITISATPGTGMKAGSTESIVAGRALADFDGKTGVIGKAELKDSSGAAKQVNFGRISADITVSRNPLLKNETPNIPEFLRKAAETIAGKPVNSTRIYLSIFVFVICTIAAISIMYAGVRNGLISIGRNPLSKKSIVRGMFQVILTGLIIFITGVFAVYLLLKI